MKKFACALSLIGPVFLCTPLAMADENNLSGGAFIVHHEPLIVYTSIPPTGGWCGAFTGHEISAPAQEVVRINGPGEFVWYILAAWDEPKKWCGTEFGFGTYDPAVWTFEGYSYGPCFQVEGQGTEISTQGWPGPNEGTAFVANGELNAWQGNWVPVYYFTGYAYGSASGTTVIPISFDPGSANSFCGFCNCGQIPQDYEVPENTPEYVGRGGMGINTDGIRAAPNTEVQAVCCIGTVCLIRTESDCADLGGEWHSEWNSCEPNPCDPVHACCFGTTPIQCGLFTQSQCWGASGVWHEEWDSCDPEPCRDVACCIGEVCTLQTELECLTAGGLSYEGVESCTPNPCVQPEAACCFEDGTCIAYPEAECLAAGGTWMSAFESCSPNPCPQTYTVAPDGSGDFPTIQTALDAVSAGDIIALTDGVFRGIGNRDLDYLGKAVTVRSQSGNPAACIIDCEGTPGQPHRGFDFHTGEGAASILEGVTIRGGLIPPGPQGSRGAGIRCVLASPTWRHCVILANTADQGCAIHCDAASPTIDHCTLVGNTPVGSSGSALALVGSCTPVIANTLIAFNDDCIAVDCGATAAPVLSCCDIVGNPGGDWIGVIAPQQGVNGNFSADPVFCDLAAGDLHLSCDSPCLHQEGCDWVGALPEGCQLYAITSIRDMPNDQGRAVRIRWHRACTDLASGEPPITMYSLWRRIDELDRTGAHRDMSEEIPGRAYPPGEWEYLTSVPACGEATYATVCATVCDSTLSSGMCWSVFFIRAHTAVPTVYFDTVPDSGYSLDNLAPGPPEGLCLVTPSLLAWDGSSAADFDYFTVYGSGSEQFDSTAVLLGRTSSTSFALPQPPYPCYHVTATDFSGNEGGAATLCDYSGVSGVDAMPSRFALGPARPNPLRNATWIQMDVPRASQVSLRVYDAAGRLVATLVEGPLAPGRHQVEWSRVGGSTPPVPSGIYFLRMRSGDFTERRAVVVLE